MSIETLTSSILAKMQGIHKRQRTFFVQLIGCWLALRGRYNFENMSRQMAISSYSLRQWFGKKFDFKTFNSLLIQQATSTERIWVFDPSHIGKAGKHTPGLGYFWSGCAQAVKWGLEISGLAMVDVGAHTALHYHACQTLPEKGQTLLDYYTNLLVSQAQELKALSYYLAVDAYFAKYSFVTALTEAGIEVVTRLRSDSVLYYPYLGPKKQGRGRPQKYQGKVDVSKPDSSYFRPCLQDQDMVAYQGVVHSKALKRLIQLVIVHHFDKDGEIKSCKLYAATDTALQGIDLWLYYHQRFQVEFLYRDAKQHLGLTHCQSRNKERLWFHFNFSLTLVSLAKVAKGMLRLGIEKRVFSLQDIKTEYSNIAMIDRFICAFGLCRQTLIKIPAYQMLVNYAKILV